MFLCNVVIFYLFNDWYNQCFYVMLSYFEIVNIWRTGIYIEHIEL